MSYLSPISNATSYIFQNKNRSSWIERLWTRANRVANLFPQDQLSRYIPELAEPALSILPRTEDTGDFVQTPRLLDTRLVLNLIRRYFGSPESRAVAWEELAIYLDRWGWRMSDKAYSQAARVRMTFGIMPEKVADGDLIIETEYFKVYHPKGFLVSREDGSHLAIYPKRHIADRSQMTTEESAEYIRLSMATTRAMLDVLKESGIPVERLNIKDMGNWKLPLASDKPMPRFHEHLLGRARGSRFQVHGEFMRIPPKGSAHYQMISRLRTDEIARLRERAAHYLKTMPKLISESTPPSIITAEQPGFYLGILSHEEISTGKRLLKGVLTFLEPNILWRPVVESLTGTIDTWTLNNHQLTRTSTQTATEIPSTLIQRIHQKINLLQERFPNLVIHNVQILSGTPQTSEKDTSSSLRRVLILFHPNSKAGLELASFTFHENKKNPSSIESTRALLGVKGKLTLAKHKGERASLSKWNPSHGGRGQETTSLVREIQAELSRPVPRSLRALRQQVGIIQPLGSSVFSHATPAILEKEMRRSIDMRNFLTRIERKK